MQTIEAAIEKRPVIAITAGVSTALLLGYAYTYRTRAAALERSRQVRVLTAPRVGRSQLTRRLCRSRRTRRSGASSSLLRSLPTKLPRSPPAISSTPSAQARPPRRPLSELLARRVQTRSRPLLVCLSASTQRAAAAHERTNCVTEVNVAEALQAARDLDTQRRETGVDTRPLSGLPFSAKDSLHVRGLDSCVASARAGDAATLLRCRSRGRAHSARRMQPMACPLAA
jgi:hypothetical protein